MKKNLRWYNLALMAFSMVWGFTNMVNNFALQGSVVVFSWVLILVLYFTPYALMVGELGSAFRHESGGVASWIGAMVGPRFGYFAGWTYWVVHIPYLAQRPQSMLIAFGWIIRQDETLMDAFSPLVLQLICLGLFMVFWWLASKGIKILKTLGTVAGTATLIMSLLYILLMLGAPFLTEVEFNFEGMNFIPHFDFAYFTTLSMLIFAVGGAEKISPYINHTQNPAKEFPKGMIALIFMIGINAVLGSVAMGLMFQGTELSTEMLTNGQYYAFQKLGEYYGWGNVLLIIYGVANLLAQASALVFAIDAPLRMLIGEGNPRFIPAFLKKGNPSGGYWMTAILTAILIILPAFGLGGSMDSMFAWLLNLNTVVMPIRYLWVFAAYLLLKKQQEKFPADYRLFKSRGLGALAGSWCFALTFFAICLGMVPKGIEKGASGWGLQLGLNIGMPFILLALGLTLPFLAKKSKHNTLQEE